MFSRVERMIAFRYLRARRQEGFISVVAWLSVIGIALGVGTLIVVLAVMNGFRHDILSRILGFNGHISVYAGPVGIDPDPALIGLIRNVDGVVRVNALVQGQVIVTANGVTRGAFVRGMDGADLAAKALVAENIRAGSLDAFDTAGGVVIGQRLAEAMGLALGDTLTAISPKGNVTAFGTMPRVLTYRVDGVFEAGMTDFDEGVIFMPLAAARSYFKLGDRVTTLEVFVDDPARADAIASEIEGAVGAAMRVLDWQRSQSALVNALKVERNVLSLILTMIIIVAAFNIISGLVILVKDKAGDIAILRTMGATRGMILRVFFLSGASIGVSGTLLGFGLGLAFAANIESLRQGLQSLIGTELFSPEIYFLSRMPSRIDPAEVAVVVVVGLLLSFLATLYPSWRAAPSTRSRRCGMSETVLQLTGIIRTFRQGPSRLEVLRGVDLAVGAGEVVALTGPSGAGKSTLLHIAGLLERADGGEVQIDGTACSGLGDDARTRLRRHAIGFVYQQHHLLPEFSAEENVTLPQLIAGTGAKQARERSRALLQCLGLGERLRHRPGQLSGGEQQRVAIARAVANVPRVLLADEPTGNLDPPTAADVFAMLMSIARTAGLAAVIATHNLDLAARMDRVVHLADGMIRPGFPPHRIDGGAEGGRLDERAGRPAGPEAAEPSAPPAEPLAAESTG